MPQVQYGDTVKVHYTGKLEDGTVFDTSKNREPFEFQIGSGNLIKGFETGVVGMETGSSKTLTILPEEGYGLHRKDLIAVVERKDVPENIELKVGLPLQIKQPNGNFINVMVADMDETTITLDANHPLAGKTLVFDIDLIEIA
ncbi:MAG: peptidylprolyl isomerase [Desulfobacterales bacterium]|nr:peptidylprolyl isomerase [Desulfobacterales bacterium]